MGELVRLDLTDGIATITLDSQHNRNALSRQLVAELADVPRPTPNPLDVRAVVLRHEGPAFCAGADLKERSDDDGPLDSSPMVAVMRRLMEMPTPHDRSRRRCRSRRRDRPDGVVRPRRRAQRRDVRADRGADRRRPGDHLGADPPAGAGRQDRRRDDDG